MRNRYAEETALYSRGFDHVIGVDEVGRGPLAGPVVAAAVAFQSQLSFDWWVDIKDSKKLSERKRQQLTELIRENSKSAVGLATVEEIEQLNILSASLLAMNRAVRALKLPLPNSAVLVDGNNLIPELFCKQQRAIVKGDDLIHTIAAASILAKVTRDQMMQEFAGKYPEYEFDKHKGYGTRAHITAIKKYGLSPIHRASFCGKIV